MIRRIGLTGGLASGKSRVAEMLAGRLDCIHIDADEVCRRLLEPQAAGWQEFSRVFGSGYLTENGDINRPLLRKDLFGDAVFRQRVNAIIHPLVQETIVEQMDRIVASGPDTRVLVEVPLLYEVQWQNLFDIVVVVYADHETCIARLMNRDRVTRQTAVRELESQLSLEEKVQIADHVIDNSGPLTDTESQVMHLADLLMSRNGSPVA